MHSYWVQVVWRKVNTIKKKISNGHFSCLNFQNKMSKYPYALVFWTRGPDKDAVSIVPTNWIIDFDQTDTSRTNLVECHMANTKKPVNGWQVEYAEVLQLAKLPLIVTLIIT